MNNLLHKSTLQIARYLGQKLPQLSQNWWETHVFQKLSFQQQRNVESRQGNALDQLDFAALIRVIDKNWQELRERFQLPLEGMNWIKELQSIRNRWAHLPAGAIVSLDSRYRDIDTLLRFVAMIEADSEFIKELESVRAGIIVEMAPRESAGKEEEMKEMTVEVVAEKEQALEVSIEKPSNVQASKFSIGDEVSLNTEPNNLLTVIKVIPGSPEFRYEVIGNSGRETYYERQLKLIPKVESGRKCLNSEELNAYLTSLMLQSPSSANLFSLRSGRVEFVPYQYRPVFKLIKADRPRLLIADEVGVGKTIEAGLIIKELRARMDIRSILIICPKALVAERKWELEMKRFDEQFMPLDGKALRHCLNETNLDGEWPDMYAKAILPFSLFDSDLLFGKGNKSRNKRDGLLNLDPPPKFDLVIVDEAHHIRNTETLLHHGVKYFCENAEAAIFLTATPVQLGREDLQTLLNVLRPDLVIDRASFEHMAEPNPHINEAIQHCRTHESDWHSKALKCLAGAAETTWGQRFLSGNPLFQNIYDTLSDPLSADDNKKRVELIRNLEELYTFSHLINRTRRRDIGEFTTRKPELLLVDFTPDQKSLHDDLLKLVAEILMCCHGQKNVKFMMSTVRRQAASCIFGLAPLFRDMLNGKLDQLETMEASDCDELPGDALDLSFVEEIRSRIENLLERAENLDPNDPKLNVFLKALSEKQQMPNNKALVFSTFRHTLSYLSSHLNREGLRYGLIHGGIPDAERRELRKRFAMPKENPEALDILLSSEVGCEGLDFQFCDFLINYDLPWNPMRIEQRIGRIDRYGQKSEAVAILNPITIGTVDAEIYLRCYERIGIFKHSIGGCEEILGEITVEIHDIAENFNMTEDERNQSLQQLSDNAIRRLHEEQVLEEKQAELFGLSLPKQTWRQEIEDAESFWLSPGSLQHCVKSYLRQRIEPETDTLSGDKLQKTLRLNVEARNRLLDDYKTFIRSTDDAKKLARSADPAAREWEKWLKGSNPNLQVTFDQKTAAENPEVIHLNVLHPLVRQAAHFNEQKDVVYTNLTVSCDQVSAGEYLFGVYRWQKRGVKVDETLVVVSENRQLEDLLIKLLPNAKNLENAEHLDESLFGKIENAHHQKWLEERAKYIDENRELLEHRIQSLTVSNDARCKLLRDKISAATNDKIKLMREGELDRAVIDFNRRIEKLRQATECADIQATTTVFGIIKITSGSDQP